MTTLVLEQVERAGCPAAELAGTQAPALPQAGVALVQQ